MSLTGRNHPDTSYAAAARNLPREGSQRYQVLLWIIRATKEGRGISDAEMQAFGMAANTQRPRRVELRDAGFVVDSGNRTDDGSILWVADFRAILDARSRVA